MPEPVNNTGHGEDRSDLPARLIPPSKHAEKSFFQDSFRRQLKGLFLRNKIVIVGTALLVTSLTALQFFTRSSLYECSGTVGVAVVEGSPGLNLIEKYSELGSEPLSIDDYMRFIRSDQMSDLVLEKLSLESREKILIPLRKGFFSDLIADSISLVLGETSETDEPDTSYRAAVKRKLSSRLTVSRGPEAELVIAYVSEEPELGLTVVDTYSSELISFNRSAQRNRLARIRAGIAAQLERAKAEVEEWSASLRSYDQIRGSLKVGPDPESIRQRLADLDNELDLLEHRLTRLETEKKRLLNVQLDQFPSDLQNQAIRDLQAVFEKTQLDSMNTRSGTVEKSAEGIESRLQTAKEEALEQARRDNDIALQHCRLAMQHLRSQQRTLTQLGKDLLDYEQLEVQRDSSQQILKELQQANKAAGVLLPRLSENVKKVDQAHVSRSPSHFLTLVFLILSGLVGTALGFCAAALIESYDSSIKRIEELENRLGVPCLAVVPEYHRSKFGRWLGLMSGTEKTSHVRFIHESEEPSKACGVRQLRDSIVALKGSSAFLLTSSSQGEGKSMIAVNIAVSLAKSDFRVLLIDLNFGDPEISRVFDLDRDSGIGQFLTEDAPLYTLLRQTSFPNLVVLPAGPRPENLEDLLSSFRMGTALGMLQDFFDFVLIDGPAILEEPTTLALSDEHARKLLIVRAGQTSADLLGRALRQFSQRKKKVVGTILNAADPITV